MFGPPKAMAITGSADTQAPKGHLSNDVEAVKCASCGFTEDCTSAYISRVRDKFNGRWICGLCIEAVNDELLRSEKLITTEEAIDRHVNFCEKFRSLSSIDETEHPIFVMCRVLRRTLDSPRRAFRTGSSNALGTVVGVPGDNYQRT